jgi:hypothetical protein
MDDWAQRRLAELEAAAPDKRKKIEPYVEVKLAAAAEAFVAVNCQKAMVYLWLLQQARMTGKTTFAVPNGALAKYGVSRKIKCLALQQYEEAGLIAVEWRPRKTPIATLLHRRSRKSVPS